MYRPPDASVAAGATNASKTKTQVGCLGHEPIELAHHVLQPFEQKGRPDRQMTRAIECDRDPRAIGQRLHCQHCGHRLHESHLVLTHPHMIARPRAAAPVAAPW